MSSARKEAKVATSELHPAKSLAFIWLGMGAQVMGWRSYAKVMREIAAIILIMPYRVDVVLVMSAEDYLAIP